MFLLREGHLSKDAPLELSLNRIPIPNPKKKKEKNLIISIIARVVDPRDRVFEWRVGVGDPTLSIHRGGRRGTSVKVARKPRIPVSVPRESRKSKVTSAMPRSFFTHGEFVAPNGEPLDVGHRLPVWQRERDVLPSIPLQRVRSIGEIDRIEVFLYPRDEVGSGWFRSRELESFRSSADEGIKKKKKKESEGKKRVS